MPISHAVLICGLMAVLGAFSAFFSAMETALFSLQPAQIARLREQLPQRASAIAALQADPRRVLSLILLADTLANLPLCVLSLYFLDVYCAWNGAGGRAPFLTAALLLFALVVGACDLLPKLFALRHAERVAKPALSALFFMRPFLDPVCGAFQRLGELMVDPLLPANARAPLPLSAEEFEALIDVSVQDGALQGAESEMIQEIIKLCDKTAKDCMTPRVEVFALNDDLPNDKAADQVRAERRHRIPVYADTPDNIIGVLDAEKFLLRLASPSGAGEGCPHFTEIMDPPSYISETMPAVDLLRGFLSHPQGLAVLVDEYGGTEGIVTLADLIEEIVGDVLPSGEEDLYIEELEHGRLLAGGHARLDDIGELLGVELEAQGLDTISGLIFNRLGYLPHAGSTLELPPSLKLTVRRVTRKRITEVLIEHTPAPPVEPEAAPARA